MTAFEVWSDVLSGAFMMGAAAAVLFFLVYWRKTADRLFAILAIAFAMFALERLVLAFVAPSLEGRHWIFLARFVAFLLIIVGIVDKNRPPSQKARKKARKTGPARASQARAGDIA